MKSKITFKPISRKQAQIKLLERIALCIRLYEQKDMSFYSPIEDVKTPRDLELLFDSIYYTVKDSMNNLSKANKILDSKLHSLKLNWKTYFIFRYEIDNICHAKTISPQYYSSPITNNFCCIVVYMMQYIEVCKLKTNSNEILNVDIRNNRVNTKVGTQYFDPLANVMRSEQDTYIINNSIDTVFSNFAKATKQELSNVNPVSVYDRIDDTLRLYQSSCILVDIINQVTGMDFAKPIIEGYVASMDLNSYVIHDKDVLRNRKRLSSYRGTVIDTERIKLILKDVSLSETFKCIVCQYTELVDGVLLSGTSIFPLNMYGYISGQSPESVCLMLKYYRDELDTKDSEIELYDYIDKHTYNKASKDREYREVSIAPYLRRAGSASDKAKKLARDYGLELPDGYTLVDEHIRHYNKDMRIN